MQSDILEKKPKSIKTEWGIKKRDWLVLLLILLFLLMIYGRVGSFDFVGFDDDYYVYENENLLSGLNWRNIVWAFSFSEETYWHPLTWISLMTDMEMFGLNPGAFHIVNLFWHFLNANLLYLLLRALTREWRGAALVAILFAIHPINVESVAWITERKNVLSTFFIFSSLLAYTKFLSHPHPWRFFSVLTFFSLGLLSKPIAVITPFLFILIDIWPLRRYRISAFRISPLLKKGIAEKIPFFLIGFFVVLVASHSLERQSMGIDFAKVPLDLRLSNAATSYVAYLLKILFPVNLGVFYPYPRDIPFWKIFGSLGFLLFLTIFFLGQWRKRTYLGVGWLWYVGGLFPVSGFKQAGLWPAYADRWAYIPQVGILIITVWFFLEKYDQFQVEIRRLLTLCGLGIILAFALTTFFQVGHWENSEKLFSRTISVTENNWIMHYNLGKVLEKKGRTGRRDRKLQNRDSN